PKSIVLQFLLEAIPFLSDLFTADITIPGAALFKEQGFYQLCIGQCYLAAVDAHEDIGCLFFVTGQGVVPDDLGLLQQLVGPRLPLFQICGKPMVDSLPSLEEMEIIDIVHRLAMGRDEIFPLTAVGYLPSGQGAQEFSAA